MTRSWRECTSTVAASSAHQASWAILWRSRSSSGYSKVKSRVIGIAEMFYFYSRVFLPESLVPYFFACMNVQCRLRCWKVHLVRVLILTWWQSAERDDCGRVTSALSCDSVDASTQELRVPSWLPALQENYPERSNRSSAHQNRFLMLVVHTRSRRAGTSSDFSGALSQ